MSTLQAACPRELVLQSLGGAQAKICTRGAQVMSWTVLGQDRLFTSPYAVFRPGQALRGGIPVIFPQFGAYGSGLRHGFARLMEWVQAPEPKETAPNRATLLLTESSESMRWWPHRFRAELDVELLENGLSVSLSVDNHDEAYFEFTAALHTYLRVSDIERARVLGLQTQTYIDAANGGQAGTQQQAVLDFTGEVDRVYVETGDLELSLLDGAESLRIRSEGFTDTVVWNPGADLAAGLADLGPGNHKNFVCVEAAQVMKPVRLAPGGTWRGNQTLACVDG